METGSTARDERGMASDELWKEQLGYVSGTIVAWGAGLLQFWPQLARLQTGAHVRAMGRDEGLDYTAMSYYVLALLVALGLGMLIFGSIHILARGFWLARLSIGGAPRTAVPASERIARSTYVVLHTFWTTTLFLFCLVALSALSALLATYFRSKLGWPIGVARTIASIVAFAPLYATGFMLFRRRRSEATTRTFGAARRVGYRNVAIAYSSLVILWLVAIQFSYVADLRLERHVFSRSTDPNVIVSVELGGAVSNPSPLRMSVTGSTTGGKLSAPLHLTRVGSGRYVSVLPTSSLPIGDYEISMTYPHGAISPAFPFFRSSIYRSVGFVLVD